MSDAIEGPSRSITITRHDLPAICVCVCVCVYVCVCVCVCVVCVCVYCGDGACVHEREAEVRQLVLSLPLVDIYKSERESE